MTTNLKTHWFSVWLMALLFSFSWSLPVEADILTEADELLETADNYSVSLFGQTAVKIKMPIYGKKGTDHWISKAEIKVFDVKNSTSKSSLLKVEITKNDDISNSADKVNYGFTSDVPGMMELVVIVRIPDRFKDLV